MSGSEQVGVPGARWHLVGDDAVLVDLPDAAAVDVVAAGLRAAPPDGVVDVVPAALTVLVRGSARARARWAGAVRRLVEDVRNLPAPEAGARARLVEIPVVYDGTDLAEVAGLTGLSVDEVVARHLAGRYRVAFGGFMPGFAYLVGLDPALHVARLATPRTRVPAGAVAVAGEYAAVYPRATPGGWRLLGRTDAVLFDPADDERPALLAPGDGVRFVVARGRVEVTVRSGGRGRSAGADGDDGDDGADGADRDERDERDEAGEVGSSRGPGGPGEHGSRPAGGLEVLASGPLTLVEDAGRPGLAEVGVPRSGAADPAALRAADRLVGNRADAAVLETVLGGLVVRFAATTAVALVGTPVPADLDGVPVPMGRAVRAPAGATLTLGAPATGLRTWLAVRGGIDVPPVLGSRSADVLSGLGPRAVAAGDVLPVGHAVDGLPELPPTDAGDGPSPEPGSSPEPGALSSGVSASSPGSSGSAGSSTEPVAAGPGDRVVLLPATAGPRADRLTDEARRRLTEQVWTVRPESNRVAVRLDGPPLTLARDDELPSEGLVAGAVQVPHDGRPVVFGPDHPVTGGYPVVAVLTGEGLARAAQCRPGDRVRLVVGLS